MSLVRRYIVVSMLTASYVCDSPAKVQMDDCDSRVQMKVRALSKGP